MKNRHRVERENKKTPRKTNIERDCSLQISLILTTFFLEDDRLAKPVNFLFLINY